ncbi:MAG: hypothetical protein ACKV2O_23120 [Acidimicrobiales bacterium]
MTAALGRPIGAEPDHAPLTLLDAARLALGALDTHLATLTEAVVE